MDITELGDGLKVSPLGFGAMAVTHVYGGTDDASALAVLNAAVDAGVTLIDTADAYGAPPPGVTGPAGTNEQLVGRLLADRRDEVTLATKFGIIGLSGPDGETGAKRTRGDATYVRDACEASLRRLGVDVIDLWYMHRRDRDVPIEETAGAMAEMVAAGKVRHLVVSGVAARIGATNAQVALAWLYAAGRRAGLPVVPIPGTRSIPRVQENAAAVGIPLDHASIAELDTVAGLAHGDRNIAADPTWISSGRE